MQPKIVVGAENSCAPPKTGHLWRMNPLLAAILASLTDEQVSVIITTLNKDQAE